jgi:hypothetical protein
LQRANFGFESFHFFFGSLSSASILRFEELNQLLYIPVITYVDFGNCHDRTYGMSLEFRRRL